MIEFAAVDAGRLFSQNVDLDIASNFTILKYDDWGHALFLQVPHSSWKTVKVKPADVVVEPRKGFDETLHERTAHENPGGRQVFEVSWKDFNIEVLVPERREAAIRDCYIYFVPSISSWICRVPLSWRQKRRGKGATVAKQKNFGRTALHQGSSAPTTMAIAKARQLVISDVCKLLQILPPQTTCDEEKAAAAEMTRFLEARASVAAENNEEEADLKKELKYIDLKPGYFEEDAQKLTKANTKKATPCKPPGGGKSNLMKSSGKKMPPPSFLPVKKNQDKQRAQATKGKAKQPSSQSGHDNNHGSATASKSMKSAAASSSGDALAGGRSGSKKRKAEEGTSSSSRLTQTKSKANTTTRTATDTDGGGASSSSSSSSSSATGGGAGPGADGGAEPPTKRRKKQLRIPTRKEMNEKRKRNLQGISTSLIPYPSLNLIPSPIHKPNPRPISIDASSSLSSFSFSNSTLPFYFL